MQLRSLPCICYLALNQAQIPATDWADWSLRKWDAATGKELQVTRTDLGAEACFTAFSPDGQLLAVVTREGTLRLWDTDAGKQLRTWKVPIDRSNTLDGVPLPLAVIRTLDFAVDGKTLFASTSSEVHRWNAATGDALPTRDIPGAKDFSKARPGPDIGTALTFTHNLGRLSLLDLATGRAVRVIGRCERTFEAVACAPDGRTLAAAVTDARGEAVFVSLWEVASGRGRGGWDVPFASSLAFAPDGSLLAVGGDGVVRLFHLASGREVGRLAADYGNVSSLAFSPDGKRLAVAGDANTVLIADVAALTADKLPKAAKLGAKERDALWDDLGGGRWWQGFPGDPAVGGG